MCTAALIFIGGIAFSPCNVAGIHQEGENSWVVLLNGLYMKAENTTADQIEEKIRALESTQTERTHDDEN